MNSQAGQLSRFERRFVSRRVFGPAVGVVLGALMAVRLFVPGPIGMADNGDGPRLMCALNAVQHVEPGSGGWEFAVLGYTGAGAGQCGPDTRYPSSGVWLLRAAQPLGHWLGLAGPIDLRALAVLSCLLLGLAFGVFAAALHGRPLLRLLLCLLLFAVVGDAAFAGYAAAPYGELAGLLGIVLATAGALHLGGSPRARLLGLLVFVAGAVLAVGSKVQSVTMASPFVALLLVTRVPVGRYAGAVASRVLPWLVAVVVAGSAMLPLQAQNEDLNVVNSTEMIFVDLLGKSSDPAAATAELGLPPEAVRYAGRSWWAPGPPESSPQWPEIRPRMNHANIARFLLRHPAVAARIWAGATQDFGAAYPDYLGSYPAGAGQAPRARETRLHVYSSVLRGFGGGPVLLAVLVLGAVGLRALRTAGYHPARRAALAAMLCLVGVVYAQFVTAAYGEAVENTKHLVFAILAAGLVPVLAATAAYGTPGERAGLPGPRVVGGEVLDDELVDAERHGARPGGSGVVRAVVD